MVDAIPPNSTSDLPSRVALKAFNADPTKGVREKELDIKLKGLKEASKKAPKGETPTGAPNAQHGAASAAARESEEQPQLTEPKAGTKVHTMADASQRGDELYNAFVNPVDSEGKRVEWDSKEFDAATVPKKVRDNLHHLEWELYLLKMTQTLTSSPSTPQSVKPKRRV